MPSFYILIAIFLWSSLGLVVRLSGLPVQALIFYSSVVSVVVQGLILIFHKAYRKGIPELKQLRYPLILGSVGLLNTFSFYYAYQHTTIANAILLHYTSPVFVAFLAPIFLKEPVTKTIVAAIGIATAGLWIMLQGITLQSGHSSGILAGLVSGAAYAVIIILARIYTQSMNTLVLVFFMNGMSALLLLPFVPWISLDEIWVILLVGIVHSTIAPLLYYYGLRYVNAYKTAILGYLEPLCAILLGIIFLHEIPGLHSIAGGLLILASGYLVLKG